MLCKYKCINIYISIKHIVAYGPQYASVNAGEASKITAPRTVEIGHPVSDVSIIHHRDYSSRIPSYYVLFNALTDICNNILHSSVVVVRYLLGSNPTMGSNSRVNYGVVSNHVQQFKLCWV